MLFFRQCVEKLGSKKKKKKKSEQAYKLGFLLLFCSYLYINSYLYILFFTTFYILFNLFENYFIYWRTSVLFYFILYIITNNYYC